MIFDMWFTKKEAKETLASNLKVYKENWKWQGIAIDHGVNGATNYILYRTNTKAHMNKLIKRSKEYSDIELVTMYGEKINNRNRGT